MTEQSEIIEIGSLAEVITHARRDIDAGNIGRLMNLMEVAEEIGGEEAAQALYSDVIRPGLTARWDAWLSEEPGAAEPTEDELRILIARALESGTPEGREKLLLLAEQGREHREASLGRMTP